MKNKEDLYKFLAIIYQDNEAFKHRLAWFPDGTVLETVGSRFFYLFEGRICEVMRENEKLKEQNKRLIEIIRDINICVKNADSLVFKKETIGWVDISKGDD